VAGALLLHVQKFSWDAYYYLKKEKKKRNQLKRQNGRRVEQRDHQKKRAERSMPRSCVRAVVLKATGLEKFRVKIGQTK
jgi:hypothetical protein